MINKANKIIKLTVRNHPGVMSHITGLFSRRAFNLEGILCGQIDNGTKSRMYLLINNDEHIDQIIKQLQKLYDIIDVSLHEDYDHTLFNQLDKLIKK